MTNATNNVHDHIYYEELEDYTAQEARELLGLLGNIARATHFRADDTCHHVEADEYRVPKEDCEAIEEALMACEHLPEPDEVYVGDGWNRAVRRLYQIIDELETLAARPTVKELRAQGYAVALFTPEELGDAPADEMEDHLVRTGNEFLEFHHG